MNCVNSIRVSPSCITLEAGTWYYDASVEVCPSDADCTSVSWHSDNPTVASVNESSGYIYAGSVGTARIYATATDGSGCYDFITVTVSETVPVESVTLNHSQISVEKNHSIILTATVCPDNASNKHLNWTSSNTCVATVHNGVVTARETGVARIYATAADGSGKRDFCIVTVTENILVTSIVVEPVTPVARYNDDILLPVGESILLQATVYPENATNPNIRWTCDQSSCVAFVNPDSGLVSAKREGIITIFAMSLDKSRVFGSRTIRMIIPADSVKVSLPYKTLNLGETVDLSATISPANASIKSIRWSSNNSSVATVNANGLVTAKKDGLATITAEARDGSGCFDTCTIRVDSRERVTIKQDAYSFYIEFANTVFWENVGYDVYAESFIPQAVMDRSRRNAEKVFTEKQLAFIYLFDPLGIENYVKDYQLHHPMDPIEFLFFKDRVYQEIFGVKPRLFRILPNKTINYYKYNDPISSEFRDSVYSYAEVLFGAHRIVDALAIVDCITNVLISIFTKLPGVSQVILGIQTYQALFFSGSVKDMMSDAATEFLTKYCEAGIGKTAKMYSWVINLVDVLKSAVIPLYPPNMNDIVIYNKINSQDVLTNYLVDGKEVSMEEIIRNFSAG